MKSKPNNIYRKLFFRILSFAQPYKNKLWISIIFSFVLAFLAPIRPYLIQYTVDHYIADKFLKGLIYISIIQLGVLAIESVVRFSFMFMANWLGQTVVNDIRKLVHEKIIHQELSYFDQTAIGTLTTRTINDLEAINESFANGFIAIIADILTIVAIMGLMFYTDWKLTLVSLSVFPLLILATYWFKEAIKKSFNRVRNAVAALNAFVQEHISGMYIVQVFGAEKREHLKFDTINKEHRDANIQSIVAYSIFFPIVEIILAFSTGLLVWYGATKMLNYEITPGVIIAFNMYLALLFRPLRMLADKFNTLQMGLIAANRVMQLLDSEEYLHQNGTKIANSINGAISFDDVYFSYKPGVPVLNGISFEVKTGETLALVGHTGAGKSSIISILTRLYPIQSGKIKIDNIDLEEYDIYSLRKHIGIVLQDVYLFSGTILENLTLGDNSISEQKVMEICQSLGIHHFIQQLPGGYKHQVLERGNNLSQGQRQLLSFARALLFNPSVLILDEATSSIDSESEILIQAAIDKMIQGRTAIVIAHRLSTIRKADKIIVLDKGEIKEEGDHEGLLKIPNGIYAQMYEAALISEA
ncbi:MAG TPA: ABC transporter ATP-binding protein [Edaphocola sp.]|nr:ABC transporter ATP-binding protein [Edaphocola sp.]